MTLTAHALASRFLGVAEKPGMADSIDVLWFLAVANEPWAAHDSVPWCAAFVARMCWLLGIQPPQGMLAARQWLNAGIPVALAEAAPGMDIVILARGDKPTAGHVGFFDHLDDTHVYVLGGNQGNKVSIAPFPREHVIGVRRLA